jgi:hypothetical protein
MLGRLGLFAICALAGCGSDNDGSTTGSGASGYDSVYCCALRQSATRCNVGSMTAGLMESIRQWREVGNAGDAEACEAMVDSDALGCMGPLLNYDEADAITDCT